jgi:hypothetical protein
VEVRPPVNTPILGHLSLDVLLTLAAQWLTLWLGLSLLSRRPRSTANTLAAAAFFLVAAYLLSVALLLTPQSGRADVFWDRWLSNWTFFAPVLLLHALLRLTGMRLPRARLVLALLYAASTAVVLIGISTTWFFTYRVPAGAAPFAKGEFVPGRLQFLQVLLGLIVFAVGLLVLLRTRREGTRAIRSQLDLQIAGMVLLVAAGVAAVVNMYVGSLWVESFLEPVAVLGAFLVGIPLVRYRGSLDGQLLRSDLKSSLLASALLMCAYAVIAAAAGASEQLMAGLGWFVLAVFVLSDDIRGLADRAFYAAGSRAGRVGLRTAASYAGAPEPLDVASLNAEQSAEYVEYFVALDRAGRAAAGLEGPGAQRLELLARQEFAPVRAALGLPADWRSVDGPPKPAVIRRALRGLEPRERQALGLKYLGYSDKQMAQLMGVKVNVPRSYLGAAKRKLGLSAGAPLMLFIHLAGLVQSDALPLLTVSSSAPASPQEATQIQPCEPAEDLA